jgi:hypothetical protein
VTGTVANATFAANATHANTANTVTTNAQPNITSVGTLTLLAVTGNVSAGNVKTDNLLYANGVPYNLTTPGGSNTNIQFNDTGNLGGSNAFIFDKTSNLVTASDFRVNNVNVHIGANAATNSQGISSIAIGENAGLNTLGAAAVAIGLNAGRENANNYSVAVGYDAGFANIGNSAVAIGFRAANQGGLGSNAIAIGIHSGKGSGIDSVNIGSNTRAGGSGIAIGKLAGTINSNGIAIGNNAGGGNATREQGQNLGAIAIGTNAGKVNQGLYSIAIGADAGPNAQANNTIAINATGANLNANTANALFIKPVRTVNSTAGLNQLYYDSTTGEIVVYVP